MDEPYSSQVNVAVDTVRSRRLRGEYSEGHIYIATLPSDLRRNALVVIESTYLYLVQGKFKHAMEALDSYCLPDPTPEPKTQELILGCLALMKAYTIMQCQCKVFTAWEEAVKIRKALLEPGLYFDIAPENPEPGETENTNPTGRNENEKEDKEQFSRLEV